MRDPEDADRAGLIGLSVDEAADAVAERADADRERARATLSTVAADGTVSEAGVQSALAHLAKVVSTPATRAEFAGLDVEDAREAAADAADLPVVAARLDDFDARLATVESAVEEPTRTCRRSWSARATRTGRPSPTTCSRSRARPTGSGAGRTSSRRPPTNSGWTPRSSSAGSPRRAPGTTSSTPTWRS
ncbi:hypothetical protein ACFQRB_07510 [Halobaculum litoreum]|uniref:Uncharacterized protein n=1 Tax=Halobaculum litoreum TaxID=3031998 RepID=A0ABD5XMT2_9EURY